MNEAQRLAYLDAIGVVNYVPRVGLPGARPSLLYHKVYEELGEKQHDDSQAKKEPASVVTVSQEYKSGGKESLTQLQSSLASGKLAASMSPPVVASSQIKTPTAVKDPAQINVRFHLAILQPAPEMLVLLPMAHHEHNNMQLLKNILSAIGINGSSMTPAESFIWPPALSSSFNAVPLSSSLNDARETLQALLEGYQVKQLRSQHTLQSILIFEENLGKALFDGIVIPELRLYVLPSLQVMSTSSPEKIAEAKKTTWQKLKELKKI